MVHLVEKWYREKTVGWWKLLGQKLYAFYLIRSLRFNIKLHWGSGNCIYKNKLKRVSSA